MDGVTQDLTRYDSEKQSESKPTLNENITENRRYGPRFYQYGPSDSGSECNSLPLECSLSEESGIKWQSELTNLKSGTGSGSTDINDVKFANSSLWNEESNYSFGFNLCEGKKANKNEKLELNYFSSSEESSEKGHVSFRSDSDNYINIHKYPTNENNKEETEKDIFSISRLDSDFEILDNLGSGNFGDVFKAKHKMDKIIYAIKRVYIDNEQSDAYQKTLREVENLAKINHPKTVRYFSSWFETQPIPQSKQLSRRYQRQQSTLYIQMEYCPKGDLGELLRNNITCGKFKDSRYLIFLFKQIVEGIRHLHQIGVIHRDIKPTNIFLDNEGQVKIGDFGLSITAKHTIVSVCHRTGMHLDQTHGLSSSITEVSGTPGYICPEVRKLEKAHFTPKADVYSLGIVLLDMLCVPHCETDREKFEILLEYARSGESRKWPNFISPELQELLNWLLRENPNERPTAGEIQKYLDSLDCGEDNYDSPEMEPTTQSVSPVTDDEEEPWHLFPGNERRNKNDITVQNSTKIDPANLEVISILQIDETISQYDAKIVMAAGDIPQISDLVSRGSSDNCEEEKNSKIVDYKDSDVNGIADDPHIQCNQKIQELEQTILVLRMENINLKKELHEIRKD